jgi:2-isopropylmalate synthase
MATKTEAPADIIYDWNVRQPAPRPTHRFQLLDETLRDGVQSPSVEDPKLEDKLELVSLMDALSIGCADIGLPGAGKRAFDDVVAIARHIQKKRLKLEASCAGRTVVADLAPIAEASQKSGLPLWAYTFIGSSPIRQWAEDWTVESIRKMSAEAIRFAVKQGLSVAYVTEDTTRSSPESLAVLFKSALDEGARRLVLCDTVGHATPDGVASLVRWTRTLIEQTGVKAEIEWHGHNDRNLALPNALTAIEAGAVRVHACGLGVGERVGNTSMDLLLLNLYLLGWIDSDLTKLVEYVNKVSEACRFPIPVNYPLSGADAFRTATGVHAAAIIKAQKRGNPWLADRVYSGVPAGEFGREQLIEVGHMSGMSNVRYWLELRGYAVTEGVCRAILEKAKSCAWTLSESEILETIAQAGGSVRRKSAAKAAGPRRVAARTGRPRAPRR